MEKIKSSVIKAVRYHYPSLDIWFKKPGYYSIYRYINVPEQVYLDFLAARSKGAFFTEKIRPKYYHIKIYDVLAGHFSTPPTRAPNRRGY
ncbi:MAG: KTSC domain-containing protein [Christensenellaceae bacterium]|jgi:hypothetical protein|nr:KTSC domain-containing protein [Christensenellaceae bacterium]